MSDTTDQRRLAAILAADVAGYTRLVEEDTDATVAAWKSACADVIEPEIADHSGRVVKWTGDGFLAEFHVVQDAVNCAVALQNRLADSPLDFRMGVNLSDIVDDGKDIHGEGVNIAARIEALADPGGICISGDVYNQVRNRIEATFEDLGEQAVKHVSRPVRTYRVRMPSGQSATAGPESGDRKSRAPLFAAAAALAVVALAGTLWIGSRPVPTPETAATQAPKGSTEAAPETTSSTQTQKPSVAVLPFNNMSGDPEQEYFSDGMTEDLITDLSKISALTVISRTSTFAYKGQSPDIRDVAKDLGVSHVIEGSVRKAGGQVRITVQLIDAATGSHLWADRYDREMKDIFELQDEVSAKIVAALAIKLTPTEEKRLARQLTTSPEAYESYLKGLEQVSFFNREANSVSQDLFKKAIELDPAFASAYANLSQAYSLAVENDWADKRDETIKQAVDMAKKGIEIDPGLPYAHWALGRIYSRSYFDKPDLAQEAFEKSVALNPNYADGYVMLGSVQVQLGQAEQALGNIEKGMRINIRFPFWYIHTLGQAQFVLTRFGAAASSLQKAIERNPTVGWPRRWLVASYGQLGMIDDAEWEMSELEGLGQPLTIENMKGYWGGRDPGYWKIMIEGLRKAGVPEK